MTPDWTKPVIYAQGYENGVKVYRVKCEGCGRFVPENESHGLDMDYEPVLCDECFARQEAKEAKG